MSSAIISPVEMQVFEAACIATVVAASEKRPGMDGTKKGTLDTRKRRNKVPKKT